MLFNCLMVYASSICHFGTVLMLTLGQLAHPHFCIRHHGSDRDIFSTLALHWFVFSSHCWEMVTWLVVWIPLKNMISSVGMMTLPIYGKKTCSKPPKTWSHLPKPSSNQQFATFRHRPTNSFRHSVGSPNSLVDCWDDDAILFQRLVICATFEIIQCLATIPGSQDLDSAGFSWIQLHFLSYGSKDKRKNVQDVQDLPLQKKGHFSRDHMRWWWFTKWNSLWKIPFFFLGRQRSPEGPCKPCLERPLANTIPWTDEIPRDLQGIGFLW